MKPGQDASRPGRASPNWKVRASITIVKPTATAAAITPRNFTFSCAEGVEPSQYPVLRSVIACPETDNAVHTIAAITITKNMPLVLDTPNLSKTAQEMMIVSIVIPETGLRAVVAMALAATDVEEGKNQGQQQPNSDHTPGHRQSAEQHCYADRTNHNSEKDGHHRYVTIGTLLCNGLLLPENTQRNTKRTGHDPQRPDNAENARGRDCADPDKSHVTR